MGMTFVEKVFARRANQKVVCAGEAVTAKPDFIMANDATMKINADLVQNQFRATRLNDCDKVVIIHDHQVPADTPETAETHRISKQFAARYGIKNFHKADGICHQVLLEKYILPGQLLLGADSHTPSAGAIGCVGLGMGSTDICASMVQGENWFKVPETIKVILDGKMPESVFPKDIILKVIKELGAGGAVYKAIEFQGEGIKELSVSQRFTLCNMTVEAGAKTGVIAPDNKVVDYLRDKRCIEFKLEEWMHSDSDAHFSDTIHIDLSSLVPQVAFPHSVDNVRDIDDVTGIKLDQVFVGSCTNGRLDDLRIVAEVLKGNKIHDDIQMIVAPASVEVYKSAMREGIVEVLIDAGAQIQHTGCSTCWGACQGLLASGQRMLSTQNRNFKGRSGSSDAEVYLASPRTVAISSIKGEIADPRLTSCV